MSNHEAGALRLPGTGFARELTPTWLATSAVLAGQRPPALDRPFRCVHLGCGDGENAAIVAAAHPAASVWAWDWRPDRVEATRQLRDDAGLGNIVVHERPGLPDDLGELADVMVVQDALAAGDDGLRARLFEHVATGLRPGGLACVSYATTVGWVEIVPLQTLMRQSAMRYVGDADGRVSHVLQLLAKLRDGGAKYVGERAVVRAWLDDLFTLEPAEIDARYLRDPLRPMSPAQVIDSMAATGCTFVGSARLTDDIGLELASGLAEMVAAAPSRVLQEAYRDLATRRSHRIDVFRKGDSALGGGERAARIAELELTGIGGSEQRPVIDLPNGIWQTLHAGALRVAELGLDGDEGGVVARALIDAGQAHPLAPGGDATPEASAACARLNAVWGERRLLGSPRLGTAIDNAWVSADDKTRLGIA